MVGFNFGYGYGYNKNAQSGTITPFTGTRKLFAKAVAGGNQPTLDPFRRPMDTTDDDGNIIPASEGNLHVEVEVAGPANVLFKANNAHVHHRIIQYGLDGVADLDQTMYIGVDQKNSEVDYIAVEQHSSLLATVNESFAFTKNATLRGKCLNELTLR